MSSSLSDFWSRGFSARDPPVSSPSFPLLPAPQVPFIRASPAQWKKVVVACYALLHLAPPVTIPPQTCSLTQVLAVLQRIKAFQQQIPAQGPLLFAPICPLTWCPGLCDLCGSRLYLSDYGWPSRWRCDACVLAMHLALGWLSPQVWFSLSSQGKASGQLEKKGGS